MAFADKTLKCRDCGNSFIFTAGEQDFYQSRGFENEPSRCAPCRNARKQQRSSEGGGGYSDRGYGSDYGGGYGGGGERRAPRTMHPITCAACGAEAEVPFRPRLDRPVYCSACFDKSRAGR